MNGSRFKTREDAVAYVARLNWASLKLGLRNWLRGLYFGEPHASNPEIPEHMRAAVVAQTKRASSTSTMVSVFMNEVRRRRDAGLTGGREGRYGD